MLCYVMLCSTPGGDVQIFLSLFFTVILFSFFFRTGHRESD